MAKNVKENHILIEQIINEFLSKDKKYGKATSFWISSVYTCNRKRYYQRTNTKQTNPPAARTIRVFAVGDMFHKWIQDIIRIKAKSFEVEYYVKDEKTFGGAVSGYVDCIARLNGCNTLYEFKSVNSMAFKFMAQKKYGASPSHLLQAMTYRMILEANKEKKIDQARIVYFDKDSLRIKELEVPNSPEIREAVRKDWKEAIGFYNAGVLPPAEPKEKWECRYCPFKDLCDKTEKEKK